jgi:hypothetical protein
MQDVQKDDYLTVNAGKTSVLDLNGHTINRGRTSATSYGFVVYVHGGDLTIMDSSAEQTGTITGGYSSYSSAGGGVQIDRGGNLTLAGGSITGNTANYNGGGVYVDDGSCAFTMTGGSISNNTAISGRGGGVFVGNDSNTTSDSGSVFTMTGGTISGNSAYYGGGVYIWSIDSDSHGVHSVSVFHMTGGTISGNSATYGGGVYLTGAGSAFDMTGGSVIGNAAASSAGGIYVTANTQMTIGGLVTITGNTLNGEANNVYLSAGNHLNIGDHIDAASSIGVSLVSTPTSSRPSQITSGLNGADVTVFVTDNEDYCVEGNDDGEAYLFLQATFNISVTTPTHGALSANMSKARPGKTITLTVTPDPTYRVDHVYCKQGNIEQEINPVNGVYSFIMPIGDVTVRAVFSVITFSVGLNPGEGSGTESSTQVLPVNGVYTYTLPDCPFTAPENAFFAGWELDGSFYQPGDTVTLAEDCVFTAQWRSAVIHFDANGGTGVMADVFCWMNYTLPDCGFAAPSGKFFTGWLVGNTVKQPGTVISVDSNMTVTAQWRSAVVHFDANGGTGVMADAFCGTSYTLPDCAFTAPKGKIFVGWLVDGTVEQPGTVISVDSSITVTAQWTTAYTISRVSNGFKITRAITGSAETVAYRTVSQSAITGVHFNAASGTASFNAEDDATIVTVAELAAGDNINFYYLNGSAKRSYRFEVLSTGNKEVLASYNREIDFNTSYKVPSSGAYDAKTVTVKSGETTITDDGYDKNSPISYALSGYYALVAPQNYYQLTGAELRMTLSFSAKEVDDGYQYLSVLTSATTYDNRTGCNNGDPGNISNSRYMLGFEHSKGEKNVSYASYTMPLTDYGSNCGAAADPWGNGVGYLSTQKFNTGCRASDGRLVFPANASALVLRGNASGDSDDDWVIKNIQANIQAVDTTAPVVNDVVVTQGTYGLGDTVTVALRFSEIVKVGSSSSVYLTTSFGKMEYKGGSGLNTLYFSRTLDTSSLAGALQISSVKLSGYADLAGKACTQTSLATSSFANVVYEGYNTITVNHNNEVTGPDTVYYRKHTPYVLEEPACEAPVGKEFDCYQVGSAQYQPGESFTPEAAATAVDVVWKWQMLPVTFYDEDGETVLYTGSFQYGLSPEYPVDENVAPALEKACDAGYHYSFAGWTDGEQTYADELPVVTEPAVYAAVYASEAHDWGAPSYSWSENEGSWAVTASRVCMVCGRTETEDGAVTSEITRAATCLELGETTYTGTFASECFATQVKVETDIPALGHDYVAVVTAPTCTERGYTTHTCSRCQDSYVETGSASRGDGAWL